MTGEWRENNNSPRSAGGFGFWRKAGNEAGLQSALALPHSIASQPCLQANTRAASSAAAGGCWVWCADARMVWVPGVPGRHGTFLVSPRKVPQRRRPGRRVLRCAADALRFLRKGESDVRVAFSLDTSLLAKQKKVSRPRDELPLKISSHQRTNPHHAAHCAALRVRPTG